MTSTTTDLLDVAGVAEYIGVSRSTVYRWMESGDLPYLAVSPEIRRVRRSDLDAWLDSRRTAAAS